MKAAHLGGVSENQIIIGALGASMQTKFSVARRGLTAHKLLDRKQFMKMSLASCGIAAVLGVAGVASFTPAAPPQAGGVHMTIEQTQENADSTDISAPILSDYAATATPIAPVQKPLEDVPEKTTSHIFSMEEAVVNLSSEDQAKVLSGGPVRITLSSDTGLIVSVSPIP